MGRFALVYLQGYDNFSHSNNRVTKLWSHDHIYNMICVTWCYSLGSVMDRNYDITTLISKCLYFKKTLFLLTSSTFQSCLLKQTQKKKTQRKLKELCIQMQSISVFLCLAKCADFRRKNANVSRTSVVRNLIYIFLDLLC